MRCLRNRQTRCRARNNLEPASPRRLWRPAVRLALPAMRGRCRVWPPCAIVSGDLTDGQHFLIQACLEPRVRAGRNQPLCVPGCKWKYGQRLSRWVRPPVGLLCESMPRKPVQDLCLGWLLPPKLTSLNWTDLEFKSLPVIAGPCLTTCSVCNETGKQEWEKKPRL
jgi:hypothetical protein